MSTSSSVWGGTPMECFPWHQREPQVRYSATLVDMKRTVEHSHEEPLVKMPEVEKLNRVKAFSV
eukprot:1864910-Amphidinium_carterae.1